MTTTQNYEPHISIAVYKPHAGCEAALDDLVRQHVPILRREGLVTDDPVTRMRAADGTVIEIIPWKSSAAIEQAHHNASVMQVWEKFHELCDYVPMSTIEECRGLFVGFRKFE